MYSCALIPLGERPKGIKGIKTPIVSGIYHCHMLLYLLLWTGFNCNAHTNFQGFLYFKLKMINAYNAWN